MNLTLVQLRLIQVPVIAAALAGFTWVGYATTLRVHAADVCYSTHPVIFGPGISVPGPASFPAEWTVILAGAGAIALLLVMMFVIAPAIDRAKGSGRKGPAS